MDGRINGKIVGGFTDQQRRQIEAFEATGLSNKPKLASFEELSYSRWIVTAITAGLSPEEAEQHAISELRLKRLEWDRYRAQRSAAPRQLTEREKLTEEIRTLAKLFSAQGKRWADDSQEKRWEQINAEYDATGGVVPSILAESKSNAGRPPKWNHACEFAERYLAEHPHVKWPSVRNAYCQAHPELEHPTTAKLKAAVYYYRRLRDRRPR